MFNILGWIIFGLIAGLLAKWIMPGKDPGGLIVTILIGIAGSFIGGFLAGLIGITDLSGFFGSMIFAVIGALVLLFAYRQLKK